MLQVAGVSKHFGGFRVLDDISLEVRPRSVQTIIGPNGAGKTTLFNILCGYLQPDGGAVLLNGTELLGLPPHRIARLGVVRVFQEARVFRNLSVEENLLVACPDPAAESAWAALAGRSAAAARMRRNRERIHSIAATVGLAHVWSRPAGELSYGQQRLLGIGQGLALDGSLYLLDEPTSGLNPELVHRLQELIPHLVREGDRERAVLLIEHNIEFVLAVSDRITILQHRIRAEGTPEEIRSDPRLVEAYLGRRGIA